MPLGRYFEDLEAGQEFVTPGRTIFESDLVAFSGISGDHNELHTNVEAARARGLPGPLPYVHLVMAMAAGLIQRLGLFEGTAEGFLALEWRYVAPLQIGDTVHCRVKIAELRSEGPDRGLVRREVAVLNQREEVVQQGWHELLVRRRSAG